MKKAIALLVKAGFKFDPAHGGNFGIISAEPVNLSPNHFTPAFRDVFVGKCKGGYYVTSHITGEFRGYRCRTVDHSAKVKNIFGGGKTALEAVKNFLDNFNASPKRYNVSR